MLEIAIYGSAVALILIGLYGALTKKSLIKIVLGLSIMDSGIHLMMIALGYLKGGTAPIFSKGFENSADQMVDPIPQALVLTAIVIGFGVTAVALSLVIRLYRHHDTLRIDEIKNLKW
ncbi:MAG TPA: cation:proton antiporter [Saprospiraceae bacterium]|nr:cation:proton antiporter [Saprospiraceae bacterium]